ncbi:Hypothetical protein HVR_LOCUS861 [uncultured virus]|nr:Hypothetical protein HVR_LOCUS861 [uncultured virus]
MSNCGVCDKSLGEDYTIRSGKSFHSDCVEKLGKCQSCSKRMMKKDYRCEMCLACGHMKNLYRCDVCKISCDNGKLVDGNIICGTCQYHEDNKWWGPT